MGKGAQRSALPVSLTVCFQHGRTDMTTNLSKDEIVQRIVAAFREHGYEGASLSILSQATGLGRSSLYHHFPNGKTDMAQAALDWVLQSFDALVIGPLRQTEQTPLRRLQACAQGLAAFYADGTCSCLLNIFSIGSANSVFQNQLRASTKAMLQMFSDIAHESGITLEEAQRRGEQAVIGIQGALVISRTLGANEPFQRFLAQFPQQLLKPEN